MLPRGGRVISGPRGCIRPGCVFFGRFNNQRTSEIRWTHHSDRAGDRATSPCLLKRGWLEPLLRDGLSHRSPDIYRGHLCLRTITKSHFLTPFRRPTTSRPLRKDLSRPFSPFFSPQKTSSGASKKLQLVKPTKFGVIPSKPSSKLGIQPKRCTITGVFLQAGDKPRAPVENRPTEANWERPFSQLWVFFSSSPPQKTHLPHPILRPNPPRR